MLQVVSEPRYNTMASLGKQGNNIFYSCQQRVKRNIMRRVGHTQLIKTTIRVGLVPTAKAILDMWVQRGEECRNTNLALFETIQQLQSDMARLKYDNERLIQEQERIMKSLSDKKNHRHPIPSHDHGNGLGQKDKEMIT